ncbi:MAG: glycerophosphodiester phosphodiesterase [Gammaproteobacteria bacterium]|nr:glycerophosphodiester phosphodiesterase [Gammaproteobacteria bacterium]
MRQPSALLLGILLVSLGHAADPAGSDRTAAPAGRIVPFDIEAHRGGRARRPENTLPAFADALSMGVDTLELDMGVTKDGVVVISHERGLNPDLARAPDGNYIPAEIPFIKLTLAQVKQYDVGRIRPGSPYAARFPDQLPLPGTRIPTLAELFALVRRSGDRHVRLNIETKIDPNHPEESPDPEHFVAAVLGLLRQENFSDRVMIQSFDWRTLLLVQKQAPKIPTVYLTQQSGPDANLHPDKPSPWTAGFEPRDNGGSVPRTVKAAGGSIWSPYYGDVDARSIAEAHRLGLPVIVWTVNQPEDMARLIGMGVDGIISDRPDLLRAEAAKQGLPLPAPAPVTP